MTSRLGRSVPRLLARALDPALVDLTYQEVDQVPVDPAKPWEGTTEQVASYPCRGFLDSFSRFEVARSVVQANDRKVVIAADTLEVEPTERGRVVAGGATLSVVSVRRDPLGATWELQARG